MKGCGILLLEDDEEASVLQGSMYPSHIYLHLLPPGKQITRLRSQCNLAKEVLGLLRKERYYILKDLQEQANICQ